MRVPRLFVDAALATGAAVDLPPPQTHHVRNVLRAREGQPLILFNGCGGEYHGRLTAVGRSMVTVQLEAFVDGDRESPVDIHIGLGITKREAMDAALQKATELGATAITPVITQHNATSQKSLDRRLQHWQGVVRAAAEQSERNRLPAMNKAIDFASFTQTADGEVKLIAHPGHGNPFEEESAPRRIVILVGPEGGFSDEEIDIALRADYRQVGLGPRILRADTAPLVMLTLAQARWGDLFYAAPRTLATDHST